MNTHAPSVTGPKFLQQTRAHLYRESERDTNTAAEDPSAPVSTTDESARQKINKEALNLKYTLDQMKLTSM